MNAPGSDGPTGNKEGMVTEILRDEDLTSEEIKKRLWKRNVSFVKAYDRPFTILFIAMAILWLLPAVAKYSGWAFLSSFAELPSIEFAPLARVVALVFFLIGVCLDAVVSVGRRKHGGCDDFHESVVIVREGPYRIIRHPGYLAEIVYFSMVPIILSRWVPYTILAAVSTITVVAGLLYLIRQEDNLNIKKWGEEYRQYVEQVPAVNFVKGLWSVRERN